MDRTLVLYNGVRHFATSAFVFSDLLVHHKSGTSFLFSFFFVVIFLRDFFLIFIVLIDIWVQILILIL